MSTATAHETHSLRWPIFLAIAVLGAVAYLLITQPWRKPAPILPVTDEPVQAADPEPARAEPTPTLAGLEQRWGIRVVGLRLAVGGTLLDFRYSVLDPQKAAVMLKQESEPIYLIDETSGARIELPSSNRSGTLHRAPSELVGGHTYFMHFSNPGRYLQRGGKVTLIMGNFRAEHLTVE